MYTVAVRIRLKIALHSLTSIKIYFKNIQTYCTTQMDQEKAYYLKTKHECLDSILQSIREGKIT